MKNVRLHFSKLFDARYISHLDLTRVFARAVRMSGIPFWYTEGFNTHLYLTFSLPLSLGYESICETVDLRLMDDTLPLEALYDINRFLPHGIEIFNCAAPVFKTGEIGFSRYVIELADETVAANEIARAFQTLAAQDSIEAEKKTKKGGSRTVDLKEFIRDMHSEVSGERFFVHLTAESGAERSLNPSLLLGELYRVLGKETDHCLVKRIQVLTKDGRNFE